MTRFADPWAFLLLLAVLARGIWWIQNRRRAAGAFGFSAIRLVGTRPSMRVFFGFIPLLMELAALSLIVVALARPQQVTRQASDRFGIDMVIAFDLSGSMAAEDFRPRNRLVVARDLVADFVRMRTDDRIGLVTFGSRAATRVPVTYDHRLLLEQLDRVQIGQNGDGTAIGHAIATAVNRLRGSVAESRVILLVTDGVNNAGSIEPTTAAEIARELGMRIYSIGVGSRGPVPFPLRIQNPLTGQVETTYQLAVIDIDDELLTAISRSTGGEYFRATDPTALRNVLRTIDQLEKSELSAPPTEQVRELYPSPLFAGIALLGVALLLGETVWMRLPA
jgi:Ca-activated chloride channel homolog